MQKATLFKKLKKDNLVQCQACRQFCTIKPGQTGLCGIRKNKDGELYLLVYSKAIAANLDPIEKKPLFHFLPNTKIFSIGTVGCNFGCSFCQNWDISQITKNFRKKLSKEEKLEELETKITDYGYDLPPEKIANYCIENEIPSIAYTYNEPATFFEYAYDTAKLAHEKGIKNVFVSNGYASEKAVDKIAPYLDAINIDLKAFTDEFYRKICKARLQPVLDSIKYHYEKGIWIELTTLLIPGENDSEEEINNIAEFIASIDKSIPWHISKFHPTYKMLDKKSTPDETLKNAYEIGKEVGLKYVYVGNVMNEKMQSTHCPNCYNLLIKRDWGSVDITGLNLETGKCENCGEKIEGVWE